MKELFYAALVLLMGVFLTYTGCSERRDQSKLEKYGIEVQSQPLEGYTERKKAGVTVGYTINPQFTANNGGAYKCHGSVEESTIKALENNPIVTVRYLGTDPDVCQIKEASSESFSNWLVILLGIGLMGGAAAFVYNALTAQRG